MQFNRVAIFIVAGAALLSACGDAATTGASTTALNLNSSSYATLPPTQSTLPPTTNAAPPSEGDVTTAITEYTIVAGDVPVNVAKLYGITLEALNNANIDTAGYSAFYVGLKIKIPAGAIVPGTASVPTTTVGASPTPAATTLPPSSGCTVGSHTIVEGDLPSTVAKQYDVTLDALNAANANTQGYQNFIVGVKIIIPCP